MREPAPIGYYHEPGQNGRGVSRCLFLYVGGMEHTPFLSASGAKSQATFLT